jgi:hypothetical protein
VTKKNPTVAERAVRGVLGGWVFGTKYVIHSAPDIACDGGAVGVVHVMVPAWSIKKMLANERAEKAKKARRK